MDLLLSFYDWFIGRTRTITFTHSLIDNLILTKYNASDTLFSDDPW
jgi:hypothetical protein